MTIRSILGLIIFSSSFCLINSGLYYSFIRPIRKQEVENLQKELIEADNAGFTIKK